MAAQKYTRSVSVRSQSFDADNNTVDLIWTTGACVRRFDPWSGEEFDEVLSLEPGAVRLDRLNAGAPLLDTHDSTQLNKIIGAVVPGSASISGGRGIATVKLSSAKGDADVIQKIRDGIIRNISVGYWVYAFAESEQDGFATRTVTDWEPLELSAVPIPADAGSQIRSLPGSRPQRRSAVEQIRKWARRAKMPRFGEKHIERGTSEDAFFLLLAGRLAERGRAASSENSHDSDVQHRKTDMTKTAEQRDFERGEKESMRLLGKGEPPHPLDALLEQKREADEKEQQRKQARSDFTLGERQAKKLLGKA